VAVLRDAACHNRNGPKIGEGAVSVSHIVSVTMGFTFMMTHPLILNETFFKHQMDFATSSQKKVNNIKLSHAGNVISRGRPRSTAPEPVGQLTALLRPL